MAEGFCPRPVWWEGREFTGQDRVHLGSLRDRGPASVPLAVLRGLPSLTAVDGLCPL